MTHAAQRINGTHGETLKKVGYTHTITQHTYCLIRLSNIPLTFIFCSSLVRSRRFSYAMAIAPNPLIKHLESFMALLLSIEWKRQNE